MRKLDEQTLHKVRRMAAAGATSDHIADQFRLPVEQVNFICGRATSEEWEEIGAVPPVIGPECDDGNSPVIPLSCVHRQLTAEPE